MQEKQKKILVLTGAGFTKNFNGFLAKDMWSKIFNDPRIQESKGLRGLLIQDYDYESVYTKVLKEVNFSQKDKNTIKQVVEDVYKKLDDAIRDWRFNNDNPTALNISGLWGDLFSLANDEKDGYVFTLNQDLFFERHNGWRAPGPQWFPDEFYSRQFAEFKNEYFVKLPGKEAEERVKDILKAMKDHAGLNYIKLHGSYGWHSADGSSLMVIGKNKKEDIEREPLLKYYFEIFEKVIKEGDRKLLIIGYGFGDQHINQIITDAVKNHGLKLYIITTSTPQEFETHIRNGHYYAIGLMDGIRGYFPYNLAEIFPKNQNISPHIGEIKKALIG